MGTKYKQPRGQSILQQERYCYVTMKRYGFKSCNNLELHHIFFGNKAREVSDRCGFWVWLDSRYHTRSNYSVHGKDGADLDLELKQDCQLAFESEHSRQEFMNLIGKSYL